MAPSVDMDIRMEKKKRKKSKDLAAAVDHVEDSDKNKGKKKKKKKNKEEAGSVKEGNEAALIQLVAKYLEKRNLAKTLSSFLSETQCENSWKTQTIDLEDIFNQYSNQDSEKLKKHNEENINNHVDPDSNLKLQEQELKTKNADNIVNSKVEPAHKRHLSVSGSLKPQAPGSDENGSSSDDSEDEVAVSKKKNSKELEKERDPDSEKLPKQTNSGKQGNLLQESLEVMKEEKKKRKKNPKDKDLIDSDEQKTSIDKENRNSCKDNSKPSKAKRKQRDSENLGESLQESLEVPKEEKKKKKKKKIEDKDMKKKEEDAEGKDNSNNDKENNVEMTKKEKFKKLETSGSNVINEEPTTNNLKDSTEDTDNPSCDTTPLNKKVKEDGRNIGVSSNSKQNSVETTTAKAFQRVKLEEVKFVDPRLKDNSYWAKSGAEVGYGAKAEQVLGQVRGKDFRHEKTKKKRGSYKGGMIDLQSHSIKFSYSDEE